MESVDGVNSVLKKILRETWYAHCVFLANLTEGENSHDERPDVQVDVVGAAHFCDLEPIPCTPHTHLFFGSRALAERDIHSVSLVFSSDPIHGCAINSGRFSGRLSCRLVRRPGQKI